MNAPPQAVDYIQVTRDTYDTLGYPPYAWVHNEGPVPWAPMTKPLADCTVGLIASGGIYRAGQIAFHFKDDHSYRVIGTDTPAEDLRVTHFAYDLTDARQDVNVVFPLEPLHRLVEQGVIGGLAPEAYTFMGGIYSARRVREELAPTLRDRMVAQGVDVVLLVPV
ncbi:MAG: hypothetical protein FJW83_05885 [Actinobacteria bacterium]|nr:hypothetical protein [Actinomycetota bacterium]